MKVSIYLVIYEGQERKEIPIEKLTKAERGKLGKEMTDRFMKRAGFSPVQG